LPFVALASQKSGMVLHFLCFYGHPTLSTWFTSEYQKSGKKLVLGNTGAVTVVKFENGIKHILTAPRSLGHNIVCAHTYWPRSA